MKFSAIVEQASELLQQKGRLTYRALRREFDLDDEALADLTAELIDGQRVAADEDGKVLVWTGQETGQESEKRRIGETENREAKDFGPRTSDSGLTAGERRQLTVMFCDLVGSTALSARLDPEELRDLVRAYQQTCADVIQRHEGYIAQYLGDGLLVYFGYPVAHEDDAQRAVRAGLGIVTELQKRNTTPNVGARCNVPLQVRVGIHTGLVVVGEMGGGGKREQLALGETPNIAARVQGLAEPDSVVLSAATYRLVQGLFECHDLGPQTVKGLSTLLPLYRVVGESAAQSRFEAAVHKGLTPLVGRAEELALLQQRWEQAKAGAGQVVLLSGEPGIGKSRLVQEFKDQLAHEGVTRIEFRCSPYHQNSAFYPITEHLQRLLQFAPQDAAQVKLDKLARQLTHYRFPQAETFPLVAALLSLPHPEGVPPITLSPQKQKQKTQEALVAWIVEEADTAPVCCAWEDLHWADPSTLEFLALYLEQIPTTRVFTVLTFRPDFTPPWGPRSYLSQLTLSRLGRSQVETLVEKVTSGKPLPLEVIQQIVAKTDGVPLFIEELTKMVLESGLLRETEDHYELTGALPPLAIPSTLQDSLMARLDRLVPVREIAQLGATLGREFSYELIHAVSSLDEGTLQHGLRQLVETELVYQRGVPPQAHYLFKHALIQDTAYQSLLKSTRQQYHQQIAQVIEKQFPATKDSQPELVAHHYTEAGLIEQAISYWQQAGQRAVERSAHLEAIDHLTKGISLLKTLPETSARHQWELILQNTLAVPLVTTRGYTVQEVQNAYARARELCQLLGETSQVFPTLWGLWSLFSARGEFREARELAAQCLALAERGEDQALLLEAHFALGASLFHLGELSLARIHLKQVRSLYDQRRHRTLASIYGGQDPGVTCLVYEAMTLCCLGYLDQALRKSHEALTLAQELDSPFSHAIALFAPMFVHQFRHERQATQERAEALMTFSREQGFPHWLAWARFFHGWALADERKNKESIHKIQESRKDFLAMGVGSGWPLVLALQVEAYDKVGSAEEGIAVLAETLATVDQLSERVGVSELYRLKGELVLQSRVRSPESENTNLQSPTPNPQAEVEREAEGCFHKAVEIARKQQAKAWELRAATSLARLWQQQGKGREAHDLLSEIYNWFTEGFDTKDLQEAKALLDEIA